jgi:DNA (cytosine-5)-methyltransferase 1
VPTFGSLFSGIGGLDLGLERAGWECRWQVEIDEWCQRVLAVHWPDVPRFGDVQELGGDDLAPVDLVCGGFPCQPVAQNGRRRGGDDERWLWPEFARIIRVLRPRLALVENVPDLVVRGMADVQRDLAALGYDAEWDCLPASAFGAPHRRERIFVVAYADGVGREAHGVLARDPRSDLGEAEAWRSLPRRGSGGRVRPFPDGGVLGMADGPADRVDEAQRIRAIGNAVLPQVAEWIGRRLMEVA